jgi:hypothetical protein
MELPRHVVFSRKGFDGGTGCVPSPIFSDGAMFSLPIPDRAGTVSYDELFYGGHSFGKLVIDLKAKGMTNGNEMRPLLGSDRAHLDPDLINELRQRKYGWRPAYGQCGKDATVLRQHDVGKGDLFLFFGWFHRCVTVNGMYHFLVGEPDLHVIFGYLRVGDVILLSDDQAPDWAKDHPHLHGTARKADLGNTLFVAADHLGLPGAAELPGAAAFAMFADALRLTAPGMTRSWWRLPKWFHPAPGVPLLSSHEKHDRWYLKGDACFMQSVARGQEFVLDVEHSPEAIEWTVSLIRHGIGVGDTGT